LGLSFQNFSLVFSASTGHESEVVEWELSLLFGMAPTISTPRASASERKLFLISVATFVAVF